MTSVVLAGGGTAGHTSPMIATAKAFEAMAPGSSVVCIGTPRGLETRVVPAAGLELALVHPVPLPRKPGLEMLKTPFKLALSTGQAVRVLRKAKADVLIGFGGYASTPAYLAAWLCRVPVVVHEANKLAGIANKVGARFAKFVGITFAATRIQGAQLVGMPMARSITHPVVGREEARRFFGLDEHRPTLLISGGSQGALALNQATLDARETLLAAGIQMLHAIGPKNFTEDDVVVEHASGARYVPVEFIDDMAVAYSAADLMLGRAGAGTVMETAVSGLPVIFVPLPWGNGEQGKNAAELVAAGGGILIPETELTAERLATTVRGLVDEPGALERMAKICRDMYPSDAAENLARVALDLAQR
ncbi:undecaprenyldiphospho-muramoylpentapeptide beta-N-acetylglucosaminyltransferase [Tessaracoccus caeni]|uniref:undecaprenyldiphospho-muramoylpentapeptide beta-N-acetylglucosaminyltransferase n=1 Tax=Tessaracoccus caeni TaxID=3031239 RepID=UPI0023DC9FAA|nr:undecaprenyldiphospho-muramoylpentapeptide beta-N-acetylglucosaminyltransferase [Tessaracoccus caeni]MDF1487903.1 undecaprenyldiphospho-muramoylpentapeptide beta-N-acetylglucosaminyltransferase [Tessaracoccus caeni]